MERTARSSSYRHDFPTASLPVQTWKLVVADEAHYIKHKDVRRTRAALLLLGADHAVLLSGTPCPNRPEELYTLMHALRPSLTGSFNAFARRYRNARRTRFRCSTRPDRPGATSSPGCCVVRS